MAGGAHSQQAFRSDGYHVDLTRSQQWVDPQGVGVFTCVYSEPSSGFPHSSWQPAPAQGPGRRGGRLAEGGGHPSPSPARPLHETQVPLSSDQSSTLHSEDSSRGCVCEWAARRGWKNSLGALEGPTWRATGLVTPVGQPTGTLCVRGGWGFLPACFFRHRGQRGSLVCGENTSGRADSGGSAFSRKPCPRPPLRSEQTTCFVPLHPWAPVLLPCTP